MFFKEIADAGVDNVLQDFANNRSERDESIVFRGISWTLFMKSENVSITRQSAGTIYIYMPCSGDRGTG